MAIITQTGSMGGATFSFDFDDVALELLAIHANNQDTRTLNFETAKGTFSVLPGQTVDRNLTPPQRETYTLDIITKPDGTTRIVLAFPHRIYFS